MHWKDFFYFTQKERLGILSLLILIALLGILLCGIPIYWKTTYFDESTATFQKEYEALLAQRTQREDSLQLARRSSKQLHFFNPNTASEAQLLEAGLSAAVAKNIIHYRAKGGHFQTKEALKRLYTISDSIYQYLEPFIALPEAQEKLPTKQVAKLYTPKQQAKYRKVEKYTELTLLALNQTDSTELKKIPGIGSYLAQKIIRYRDRLGGYYAIEQLQEIGLDYEQLAPWFMINKESITTLDLNHTDFKELLRHPYLSYEQVKAIFAYKRKHGPIHSIKQLQFLEEFSHTDLERLSYYLSFN